MISDVQFSKILRKQNVSIVHPLNWVKEPTNEMNSSHAHINLPPQKKKEPSVPVFFDVPSNSIAETRTGSGNDAAQGGIPATNATQQNSTCSTPRGFYILVLMGTFASLPFELLRKGHFQEKSNTQIQIEGEKL